MNRDNLSRETGSGHACLSTCTLSVVEGCASQTGGGPSGFRMQLYWKILPQKLKRQAGEPKRKADEEQTFYKCYLI